MVEATRQVFPTSSSGLQEHEEHVADQIITRIIDGMLENISSEGELSNGSVILPDDIQDSGELCSQAQFWVSSPSKWR